MLAKIPQNLNMPAQPVVRTQEVEIYVILTLPDLRYPVKHIIGTRTLDHANVGVLDWGIRY